MAIRRVVESDISGEPDAATVAFGLVDTWYEIDLTEDEKKKLEQALKPYLEKSRKATQKTEKKQAVPETSTEEREKIRAWGKKQGYDLANFGRIPKKVQAAYDKAHKISRDK
ncbi:Lsr2 family protein [Streptomyces sp. NPDC007083]|uniref:histone-like nucleoid-structuring protein Lsr2 n=1 Tax=Streptomyces sp. NPDC007083 TaxID=3156913 RepID=UPI0033EA0C81